MFSSKMFLCETCGYNTNRKYNLELHKRSPNACEKRQKRDGKKSSGANVSRNGANVSLSGGNVSPNGANVSPNGANVSLNEINIIKNNYCKKCCKQFKRKIDFTNHHNKCDGINPLQCSTCKLCFSTRQAKFKHVKNVKCEIVLTEEQQKIKDLEKQLEESEAKRKEAENKSTTTINNNITNNNITNNNNAYFDQTINYNSYDQLSLEHISEEDIKRLFNSCQMQYPELSEDLTRMILSLKENQSIILPEGQKSNTCAVMKDGLEMRKPLIRVLMSLGMQTAMLIRNSNVIEKNKKDIVNNQFWADNRNACGLNMSAVDELNETEKEIVQRNKNVLLDLYDCKV